MCSRSSDHAEDREQPASADDTETGRLPLSSPARTERVNNIALKHCRERRMIAQSLLCLIETLLYASAIDRQKI